MTEKRAVAGLRVEGLSVARGGMPVCEQVSLTVPPGEITVVLGANGAGKTTLLDGIAGALPAAGSITLDGRRLHGLPMHRRAQAGLAYVEQGRTVFTHLTVAENLAVVDRGALGRAFALFPRLAERRDTRAGLLSGGEQQMLVIARALATGPRVLLVDELSNGLAPRVVETLMLALRQLAAEGVGVLLVEQFVDLALAVGSSAHVMRRGRIMRSAPCAELLRDRDSLVSPYLLGD